MRVFLLLAILAAPLGAQDGAKALAQAVENRIKRGDAFLKQKKYDITLICESPLIEQDALRFQEMLK